MPQHPVCLYAYKNPLYVMSYSSHYRNNSTSPIVQDITMHIMIITTLQQNLDDNI